MISNKNNIQMKTSTILLLSFFTILFYVITTSFFSMNKRVNSTNFSNKEATLQPFSVIVAEPQSFFLIQNGRENKIVQSYRKETAPNFAPFVVRNDTLFISAMNQKLREKEYFILPKIYCTQLKSIVGKKDSQIRMDAFKASSLQITMNNASFEAWKSSFNAVSLQAVDSYIRLEGPQLGILKFEFQKSTLDIDVKKQMMSLSGSLKNKSEGNFTLSSASVQLSADKSSNYRINN
jgi:hypothetical protein